MIYDVILSSEAKQAHIHFIADEKLEPINAKSIG